MAIPVARNGAVGLAPTPLPIRALGQFTLTVRLSDGADPTPVAAQLNIGVLRPRPPSSPDVDVSPFGVSGTLNGNAGGSATRVASAVAAMAAAGIGNTPRLIPNPRWNGSPPRCGPAQQLLPCARSPSGRLCSRTTHCGGYPVPLTRR